MGRAEELALQVIGPAVQRADDVLRVAAAAYHDGLTVAAHVGKQFNILGIPYEHPGVLGPVERVIVARPGDHQLVAYIVRPGIEQELFFQGKDLRVEIPRHRELRARRTYLPPSREVRHSL